MFRDVGDPSKESPIDKAAGRTRGDKVCRAQRAPGREFPGGTVVKDLALSLLLLRSLLWCGFHP